MTENRKQGARSFSNGEGIKSGREEGQRGGPGDKGLKMCCTHVPAPHKEGNAVY